MTEPIFVFRFIEKRGSYPFYVQGHSGKIKDASGQPVTAVFDPNCAAHVFRLSQSEYMKVAVDLVRGFDRPLCKFILADVILPDTAGEIAGLTAERDALTMRLKKYEKPREKWNFRDYVAHAKAIGMPRYSMLAKEGHRAKFQQAVEEYEASTQSGASGDQASPAGASAAASA